MARKQIISARNALPAVVFLTIITGLLPHRWLAWTTDLNQVLSYPLAPFGNFVNWIGAQLHSPAPQYDDVPSHLAPQIRNLEQQVEQFKQLYYAEQDKVRRLERQLEQMQALPPAYTTSGNVQTIVATVTAGNPRDPLGAVQLNRGRRADLHPGTIGVYDGVHLLGRIVSIGRMHSRLLPLVNPNTGLMNCAIVPPGDQPVSL